MDEKKGFTIAEMQELAYATAIDKQWHDDDEPVKYALPARIALIHSEPSEALEDFRNGHGPSEIYYEEKPDGSRKPCGVPIEIADTVIRCGDFAGKYGFDLEEAVKIKMKYNKTRPIRHGNKVI